MRILYRFVLLVLASTLFSQCQRELSYVGTGDPGQVVLPSPLTANLQGNVLDENGQPAANVVITVGAQITATDTKGYFRINNASLDKNTALVTADKTGYFTAYRSFSATSGTNQVVIKLTKKNLGGTVNGVNGGDVTLSNGTKISLPANGIVKASDNSIYTGTVNIYAAFIDPTSADILDKVPGSFMGNDKDGKRVILSSYGMMAVVLESTAGEKLQVKSGSTATLTSPIPSAAQASAPATSPLWYVDESTGIWKEEGTATRQGNSYVGTVKHFTYWNCDVPVQTVNLSATFKTANGQPLVNASIVIKPTTGSYYGSAHGYTDSLGQINGPVPANMSLKLEVQDGCGGSSYSQNIGPYNEPVNLGTITIPSTTASLVTVKGKLTNCSSAPVTNGYAILSINNWVRYAKVDANGNFSTNYILCSTSGTNLQVLGVDDGGQQQGNPTTLQVTAPTTDVGTVSACGTSSTQSINYSVDGTAYSISALDSLTAFTSGQGAQLTSYINGLRIGSNNSIWFKFDHPSAAAGTYPVITLSVQNYTSTTLVQPFNVVITNFPQVAGQFYEGSITGQFKDASNLTHNLTCTFRVRRTF
ncbi:MAG: carboxypeptidase-like regulatory domain-containing protein [Flavisolibacter sp.]